MRNRSLWSVLFFVLILLWGNDVWAQQSIPSQIVTSGLTIANQEIFCDTHTINIQGPSEVKQHKTNLFEITLQDNKGEKQTILQTMTSFIINHNGKKVDKIDNSNGQLYYAFEDLGTYEIIATLEHKGCLFKKSIIVRNYQDVFFYLGTTMPEFHSNLLTNIKQNNLLLSTAIIEQEQQSDKEILTKTVHNAIPYIQQSDLLFINIKSFGLIFDIIQQLEEQHIDLANKNIIIISDVDQKIAKKILAPFIYKIQQDYGKKNIRLMSNNDATAFFLSLSINKTPNIKSITNTPPLSFNQHHLFYQFSLDNIIDTLIYYGIDMTTMGMILLFSACVFLLVFIKQVIGVPGYGLYYPALSSLLMFFVSPYLFIFLFLCALLSHLINRYINKKVILLVYAKIGLYLTWYIFISLIIGGIYLSLGGKMLPISHINNVTFIISYLLIALSAKKVFGEKKIRRIKRRIHVLRFFGLSYGLFIFLSNERLLYFFLLYPRVLIVIIVGIFGLGRYSGLQGSEIIRFRPLIKKTFKKVK